LLIPYRTARAAVTAAFYKDSTSVSFQVRSITNCNAGKCSVGQVQIHADQLSQKDRAAARAVSLGSVVNCLENIRIAVCDL